ncbi:polyphenol oxidase family protein [Bdellovibrionota bacterium FG-1]
MTCPPRPQSKLLATIPALVHSFGSFADPTPEREMSDWKEKKANWKQVHGIATCEIKEPGQKGGEVDAFFSFSAELPVAVTHADCVPILLARRDGGAVAAVHAGWRGTRARILRALWKRLSDRGQVPSDWVAAVGPAIGPCCYEVSQELAGDFRHEFSLKTSGRMLDLPAINAAELRAIGLAEVDLLRACTRCAVDSAGKFLFHSYRREGKSTAQYSVVRRRV